MSTQRPEMSDAEYGRKVHSTISGWFIAAGVAGFVVLFLWMQNSEPEQAPNPFNDGVVHENVGRIAACQELDRQLIAMPQDAADYDSLATRFSQECGDLSSTTLGFDPAGQN